MFKLNEFGFPEFKALDPKIMAEELCKVQPMDTSLLKPFFDPELAKKVTESGQEIMKQMSENQDFSWFFKQIGNPFEPQYVEDKNLEKGDYVDFLDAEGCFFCKATICGVREDTALVQLDSMPEKTIVVRRSDLLKLVPKKNI